MAGIKSQLKYGQWPESKGSHLHPVGLTVAARRLAEAAFEELGRAGVEVMLDDEKGRVHFRPRYSPSRDTRLLIERHGDLLEAHLRERASRLDNP
jgi:hypothetical protein